MSTNYEIMGAYFGEDAPGGENVAFMSDIATVNELMERARQEGRREGIEDAAKLMEIKGNRYSTMEHDGSIKVWYPQADDIRALAHPGEKGEKGCQT